jgi:hypothetical protein
MKNFFVSRVNTFNDKKLSFSIKKGFDDIYNYTHLASLVYSAAKEIMNNIFRLCERNNVPVLYSNTDSLLILSSFMYIFENNGLIGKELGMLCPEKSSNEAIVIRNGQYYLNDQYYRSCGYSHKTVDSYRIRQWFIDKLML